MICIGVKQNNKRTEKQEARKMGVFTTNWYLYKTHFKTISEKSQEQHPQTTRRHYGQKKTTTEQTLK